MFLFHGTTMENALDIIKNGFNTDSSIWTCSGDKTYFYTDKFIKEEYDTTSEEEIINHGVHEAMQQSLITLAVQNPDDYRGAVLVFDSSLMKNQNEIEPDTSCPNMSGRAVALENPDMKGLIGFYVMNDSYKELRYYTLSSLEENTYLQDLELNTIDKLMIQAILESSSVQSELFEISSSIEFTKENLKNFTKKQTNKKDQNNHQLMRAS